MHREKMNRKDPKGRQGKGRREATIKNRGSRGFPAEMREATLKSSYYFVCLQNMEPRNGISIKNENLANMAGL